MNIQSDTDRTYRKAVRLLTKRGQAVLKIFQTYEQFGFVSPAKVIHLCNDDSLTFIAFSCLGTYTGKEELRLDLEQTYFFRSSRIAPIAQQMCHQLEVLGLQVHVRIFLPDLEPRRTWGWHTAQTEITTACELMRECGLSLLPPNWSLQLWSEVEAMFPTLPDFEAQIQWAEKTQPLLVHQVIECLKCFPNILFQHGIRHAAIRQVAGYAREGAVLESLFPNAILLQSETHHEHKDLSYQPLRTTPLPIIHPFKL
ncbi:MAG: hypothetical protein ABIH21_03535 [Patescibacteria group bacterium]